MAAEAAISWRSSAVANEATLTARFGVQDSTTAHALADALDDAAKRTCDEDDDEAIFVHAVPPPKGRWDL